MDSGPKKFSEIWEQLKAGNMNTGDFLDTGCSSLKVVQSFSIIRHSLSFYTL
jgi:hypothetical protein